MLVRADIVAGTRIALHAVIGPKNCQASTRGINWQLVDFQACFMPSTQGVKAFCYSSVWFVSHAIQHDGHDHESCKRLANNERYRMGDCCIVLLDARISGNGCTKAYFLAVA